MIKLKLTFNSKQDTDFDIVDGESIHDAITRALDGVPLEGIKVEDAFNFVLNGHIIDYAFWKTVILKDSDNVLISPKIESGEAGQWFKQALLIVIVAVASVYFPPAAGVASALTVAGITIASSLLLNALIPPPMPDENSFNTSNVESSQMYSISGQSNTMKRLGVVPKVYGTHRIFPNIAATPYTEISVDPKTGENIQTLYAIYDFGLGTPQLSDLKIGDTPLTTDSFTDFEYNIVDPNLPEEALRDDYDIGLKKEFSLYKIGRTITQLSIGLIDGQETIQFSDINSKGLPQEIILDFVAPRGLYGYSASGALNKREIELRVDFALAGTSDWKPYNDTNFVDNYKVVGGVEDIDYTSSPAILRADLHTALMSNYYYMQRNQNIGGDYRRDKFFLKGGNKLLVVNPSTITPSPRWAWEVGADVTLGSQYIGKVAAVNPVPGYADLQELVMDRSWATADYDSVAIWDRVGNNWNTTPYIQRQFSVSYKFLGSASIVGNSTYPVYGTVRFTPKVPGQYQVRVRRVQTVGPYVQTKADDLTWGAITTAFSQSPINTDKRHVFLELKIKATNQLNGNIQTLSAVASQPIDVYDKNTQTWSRQLSSNPAWIFCDLLTGEVNKKKINRSRLHMDSLVSWSEFCDEIPPSPPGKTFTLPRFTCNFILDYDTTLQNVLQQVGGAAQASLNMIDGKYGVLVDRLKTVPKQIFTPINSKDFNSSRFYGNRPHGVKIKFIDPNAGWELSELVAYDNGYNKDNATELDELTTFGCTDFDQAWRFGRYMIAQNKLRQENINLSSDMEYLVCDRGDYVKVSQDVMQVGGRPARAKSVVGNVVTIDDVYDVDPDITHGITYRSKTGDIITTTITPLDGRSFEVSGPNIPETGDLIVIGEVDSLTIDCIVKSISPNEDLSAQLVLVERANEIFEYESSGELPEYDPQFSQTSNPDYTPPKAVTDLTIIDQSQECAETLSGYNYFTEISWTIPAGSIYERFEIWSNDGTGYKLDGTTTAKFYRYNINQARLGIPHGLKVVAVSASGMKLNLVAMPEVTFTPTKKNTPPSNVDDFGMSITNQTLQLTWSSIPDCDVNKYEIRYSPDNNDSWEATVPLQIVDRNVNSLAVQARTGIYYIKAVDFAGNKSVKASSTLTTIPNLFDLNIIETINDAPNFNGEYNMVERMGEAIVLRVKNVGPDPESTEYFNEGDYSISQLLDLGDIFSVRLQSLIRADGHKYGEIMSNWEHLYDVEHLNTSDSDDWNVFAEYRATNEVLAMSSWAHLYEVEHINEGLGQGFTDWRPIPTIGDATGRVFQFRVKLQSITPNVTPRLFDATIKADMPDRVDSFENLISSASLATSVVYESNFRGPGSSPNIQISVDNGEAGDYWEFEEKSLEGFKIRFYDINGNQVVRQFDVMAKGYGRRHIVTI